MNSNNPILSIIIPTLNEEAYIARLLNSILNSTYKKTEIIVSDNGSSDKTQKIVQQYSDKYSNITLVHASLKGVSVARNAGAKSANGEYVFFFDADQQISNTLLEQTVAELQTRSLDGAGYYMYPSSSRFIEKLFFNFYNWLYNVNQYLKPIACGAALVAKRSIHEKIGGFDESLTLIEDMDYVRKIAKVGKFRILKCEKVRFDMRRFHTFGMFKVTIQWWVAGIAYLGGIKHIKWKYFKPNELGQVGSKLKVYTSKKMQVAQKKITTAQINAQKKIVQTKEKFVHAQEVFKKKFK
jgi:glycosyltransferase involved in cell wall biosynthesis